MASVLGSGTNVAEVYERGGSRLLFVVPAVSKLEWGRTLDGISKASIQCTPAAAADAGVRWRSSECAGLLSSVHPWAHELVIFRDGDRVWEGPIRRPVQNRDGVTITASDVLGWTERRVVGARLVTGASVLAEAVAALTAAFAVDPNVLDYLTLLDAGGPVTDLDVKAGSGYYAGLLATLSNAGLYFTTTGRRILLWANPATVVGTTGILDPSRHLVGNIETAREGDELATKAWGVNDQSEVGTDGGTDAFYSLVERTVSLPGIVGATALGAAASGWRKLRYPAPDTLTIPDGSTLHCDAPFPIDLLVPGILTPVEVTDLCWPVEQTMMLTGLKVTQDSGGENVGVTYAPITGEEEA